MTLEQVIGVRAEDVIKTGFSVAIKEGNTVAIEHESGDDDLCICLVGQYGEKFIAECEAQHKLVPGVCFDTVLLAKAKSFLTLEEMPICA